MVRTPPLKATARSFLLGLQTEFLENGIQSGQTVSPVIVKMNHLLPACMALRCPTGHGGARTKGIEASSGSKSGMS